jgi:hypothetical protein
MTLRSSPLFRLGVQPLRYALNVLKYLRRARGEERPRSAAVVFDLSHNRFGRHLFLLAEFFVLSGFDVAFRSRARFLAQLGRYSDLILSTAHMGLTRRVAPDAVLRFTDRPRNGWLVLSDDYFRPPVASSLHVPMAMHPNMYRYGYFRRAGALAGNAERTIPVLFAGNAARAAYSGGAVAKVFGKLDRPAVLEALDAAFLPQIVRTLPGDSRPRGETPVVVCEASSCYIPQDTFLETLSRCAFFLAAPGDAVPMCHNAVEAMSVGAVPILNYPEQFHPPLEHGVNCLAFATAEDLSRRVRDALSMTAERVAALRRGALAYYGRYLRPEAVVEALLGRSDAVTTVYVYADQCSVALLQRRRREDGVA